MSSCPGRHYACSNDPACCSDPAGPWEAECAAAIRLGHGSGASESVHRGLRELVSSGGWAARLRLQEAPVPGGPGLPARCFSVDTGDRGQAERRACDRMSRLGTARPEDTPRHRRASCLARVAQVAARTEPASTCLRPSNYAATGHLLATPVDLAKHPLGVLRSSWPITPWRNWQRLSRSYCSFGTGEIEAQISKRVLTTWGRLCPSRCGSHCLKRLVPNHANVIPGRGSKFPLALLLGREGPGGRCLQSFHLHWAELGFT